MTGIPKTMDFLYKWLCHHLIDFFSIEITKKDISRKLEGERKKNKK
jgi:hypothetical protein